MKYIYLMVPAVLLAGCVGNKQIYLEDGSQGFNVFCDGGDFNWGDCMAEAGKICGPYGYKVISKTYEKGYVKNGQSVDGVRMSNSHSTHSRDMVIACNPGRFVSGTVPAPVK